MLYIYIIKLNPNDMTTSQATRFYNEAEKECEAINSKRCFIDRAMDITEYLGKKYGDETADEILELVFENEIN
jgi:hypothetical protein